jgi:uncharacterized membrane protein (DUF485 family)
MSNDLGDLSPVLSSPEFQKLVRVRNSIRFVLAVLILALHGFFVGGIAFYKQWFSQPISQGSSIPVGIVAAVTVIVLMVVLEAVYIWLSHKVFDPLQQQVISASDITGRFS